MKAVLILIPLPQEQTVSQRYRTTNQAMFCHNCGKEIPRESRHCPLCGAVKIVNLADTLAVENSEQGSSQSTRAQRDECLFKIHPAFFTICLAYIWAAALTIFATIVIAYVGGSLLWVFATALILFALPLYQHLKWSNISYSLSSAKIEIEQGVINKNSRYVALWHIQNVTVNENLMDRMLGIGDILIDSSIASDSVALKKIRHPRRYANLILAQLPRTK